MDFIATYAVLAVDHHPHCHEPFIKADWGIFHDRASLQCELAGLMLFATLPTAILLQKENVLASAPWAVDTFWPPPRNEVLAAIDGIGEVEDGFL